MYLSRQQKGSKLKAKARTHCLCAGLEHSEIPTGSQWFSETGAGSLFKQPLKTLMLCFVEEKGGEDLKGKRRKILETGVDGH